MSIETVRLLTPELIVVLAATLIYVGGAFLPHRKLWLATALLALLAAAGSLVGQYDRLFWPAGAHEPILAAAIPGPLAADMLGQYVRLLALVVGGVFVLTASRPRNESLAAEFLGTLLLAVAGVMLVGGARELVMLFLGLELISVPTYVLLFLGRRDGASAESAAKYFFLSILSSGITLYGFTFLYGIAGSTDLAQLRDVMAGYVASGAAVPPFAVLALVLLFAGLGFKIAAVPFHFYAPDVYQGTTHGNAGVLSVLPKIAGIAALVRTASAALPGAEDTAVRIALVLSLLTMTLGNVTALWQNNLRRLFAYSSIANAGYLLIGLAAASAARQAGLAEIDGVGASLFYLAAYAFAAAGTFAAFAYLGGRGDAVETIDELAGVGRAQPLVAALLAVFMFSFAGLPPLAGFWGKFALFSAAVKVGTADPAATKLTAWFLVLAVAGMVNAAVAAAYYLRIVAVMYFRDADRPLPADGAAGPKFAAVLCGLLVLVFGLGPGTLSTATSGASRSAFALPGTPASAPIAASAPRPNLPR